ncbi:hypothetical protein DRQ53_05435 [bacterium]|nr:MAG: hypothetical protein DRQ32_01955 [bacterium]RKZ16769.1 MAG: hypothetical protein DRQ53_05435 [bacterium]
MGLFNPLLVVGAGTLVGAASVIVVNVIRSRRAEQRRMRREQLVAFARRSGLDYVGERARSTDLESVNWYCCAQREASAESFFQGQDRQGRYWLARRQVQGQEHEVLGFEIRGDLNVGDVHIEPAIVDTQQGTSWARRMLLRKPTPSRPKVGHWTVQRRARGHELLDDNARRSIDLWTSRLVNREEGRIPTGLEIHGSRGWVFSARPLDGARLKDFLELALDLRAAVLQEVQRRPATISTPVNTVTGESERRARGNTRPMFSVNAAEGADLDDDSPTVMLSAQELLRDAPAPTKKVRKFVIPEPEEEVEVIHVMR